ncbi:arylsulfatase J-like [Lingula anatina]|uniref:Arylsulfatase J-like n=1 Tax=Lingula anatina TaxID=7574 RepID=A0A1S3H7V3_LINAN|nr:arylsulfatase J-like [Lingula anatina]|eukprot:XP_013381199.1 arylsulfatase J-like [Lingula anatina]
MAGRLVTLLTIVVIYMCNDSVLTQPSKPNIVMILLDDVGWNDVGWNNKHIKTPTLTKLAHDGLILNQSYTQPVCSPSRASLMTGRYPHNVYMDDSTPLGRDAAEGLDLGLELLPQKLKKAGYSTHATGKWHLGFCDWKYTPTERGFDSFYGHYLASNDYYTHKSGRGLDLWFNRQSVKDKDGVYDTNLWSDRAVDVIENHDVTNPLFLYVAYNAAHSPYQAPQDVINSYPQIADKDRRTLAAMMSVVDEGVANITKTLEKKNMMNNTLLVLLSDNGGVPSAGNNWPLRGRKGGFYEGGIRTPGFVYGGLLRRKGVVAQGLMHLSDWAPTLLTIAGVDISDETFDGSDQTRVVLDGGASTRTDIIHYLASSSPGGVIRSGDWKLIIGKSRQVGWDEDPFDNPTATKGSSKDRRQAGQGRPATGGDRIQLYNIKEDPTEKSNLASQYPSIVRRLRSKLITAHKTKTVVPEVVTTTAGHPPIFKGVWSPGWCVGGSNGEAATLVNTDPVVG